MIFLAVLLCCLGALVSSAPQKVFYDLEDAHIYFEDFVQKHDKDYKSEAERQERFEIFKNNLVNLNRLNEMSNLTIHGINMFTDLTNEEFNAKYNGYRPVGAEMNCIRYATLNRTRRAAAPPSFDWRNQNKVTSVKNQQQCNSCWSFATTGTIEGQYAIKYNQLVEFSEQQLLDCSNHAGGCSSGYFVSNAILDTVQKPGGMMTEQEYPYTMNVGQCRAEPSRLTAKVVGCRQFVHRSEEELKETLVQVGPIAIAVDSNNWNTYSGGIFEGCSSNTVNHAVLLVGYGSENGKPFWTIKNSYGPSFGEAGYIRIPMNQNACHIMSAHHLAAIVG